MVDLLRLVIRWLFPSSQGMCSCLWRLMRLRISTTVIVLEFVDQVFNFGQGFLVFSLYGLDVECISKPLLSMQVPSIFLLCKIKHQMCYLSYNY